MPGIAYADVRVLFAANTTKDGNAGVAGTILRIGEQLAHHGHEVWFSWARPNSPFRPPLERQLAYGRAAAHASRVGPHVSIVSSGDGLLVPVPLVVHSHGFEHHARRDQERLGVPHEMGRGHRWLREPAVRRSARRAQAVIAKTESEREGAIELGVHGSRVFVIPNAVEPEFFSVQPNRSTRPTVVWIGSWLNRKGREWLPRLLAALQAQQPDVELHLVGVGTEAIAVRHEFKPQQRAALRITPHTDRQGVMHACAEATAGLCTSAFEGFGKNIIEMLAANLPVVSTRTGVAPEVIDNRCGTLVDYGDDEATVNAICDWLAADPGYAPRRAAARFTWPRVGEQWHHVLLDLFGD